MPSMVNPADALPSFIRQYKAGNLELQKATFAPDVFLTADRPAKNTVRLTYALIKNKNVVGIAQLVNNGFYKGEAAVDLGYAIVDEYRQKGHGTNLVRKAIVEATENFKGLGPSLHLFAVIAKDNAASIALARKIFDEEPESGEDKRSGVAIWQFRRQLF